MAKKEGIKEKISKLKTKLVKNKYKSTIQRDRRDYVRKINLFKKFFKPQEFLLEETDQIKYTGLKKLTGTDIYEVQKQALSLLKRTQRKFSRATLNINLKTHDTKGKKRKYTINIKAEEDRKNATDEFDRVKAAELKKMIKKAKSDPDEIDRILEDSLGIKKV